MAPRDRCHRRGVRSLFYDAESRMNSSRFTKLLRYHGDPLPVYLHRQELPAGLRDGLFPRVPAHPAQSAAQHTRRHRAAHLTPPGRLCAEFSDDPVDGLRGNRGQVLRRKVHSSCISLPVSLQLLLPAHAHLLRDLRNALQVIHTTSCYQCGLDTPQLLMADCRGCRCNTPPGGVRVVRFTLISMRRSPRGSIQWPPRRRTPADVTCMPVGMW